MSRNDVMRYLITFMFSLVLGYFGAFLLAQKRMFNSAKKIYFDFHQMIN